MILRVVANYNSPMELEDTYHQGLLKALVSINIFNEAKNETLFCEGGMLGGVGWPVTITFVWRRFEADVGLAPPPPIFNGHVKCITPISKGRISRPRPKHI